MIVAGTKQMKDDALHLWKSFLKLFKMLGLYKLNYVSTESLNMLDHIYILVISWR